MSVENFSTALLITGFRKKKKVLIENEGFTTKNFFVHPAKSTQILSLSKHV
jgi:hypothetical protein